MECFVLTMVASLLAAFLFVAWSKVSDMANQTSSACRARQIIMALKIYGNDNNGDYPDSVHPEILTANEAFRRLFQDGFVQEERIFGGIRSPFEADGNIGSKPGFENAVEPGESHWALIAKQGSGNGGINPLIIENAMDARWPPRWRADMEGQRVRGRAWKNHSITIGRNDNSVNVEKLEKVDNFLVFPKKWMDVLPSDLKVLDIEEDKHKAKAKTRRFHPEDVLPRGC